MDEAQLKVLEMIEAGQISPQEGEQLLASMRSKDELIDEPKTSPNPPSADTAEIPAGPPTWWRRIWFYLFMAGVLLAAWMGYLTDKILSTGMGLGWLLLVIPLLLLGILIALLVWSASRSRWLHVRVRDKNTNLRISLPLPLRPAAWVLRFARPWVPQLKDTAVDELLLSLSEVEGDDGLLVVEVDEGEEEQVRVYYG